VRDLALQGDLARFGRRLSRSSPNHSLSQSPSHSSNPRPASRHRGDSISWVSCRASPSLERGIKLGTDSLETSSVGSS
jgi:hypothetical protein